MTMTTLGTAPPREATGILLVSAHRNVRGPFTAAAEIFRAVSSAIADHPEIFAQHDTEILAMAPEYATILPASRATQTSTAPPQTRTRYYPPAWATRLSHGLVEFIFDLAGQGVITQLHITDADQADPTDAEFLEILSRRAVGRLPVTIHPSHPTPEMSAADATTSDLARRYVNADCTSTDPAQVAAYTALGDPERRSLHDSRLTVLQERLRSGETSLRRWARNQHALAGSDPGSVGARILSDAIENCVLEGFYDAVIDIGEQLLPMLNWDTQTDECWMVTAKVTVALSALGRIDEAEAWYDRACAATTDPGTHLQAHYGRAMLYTRFRSPDARDHQRARGLVKTAVTIASLLPDRQRRAFNTTFNENGLALVEMHLGNLDEALRLVEAGMTRLDEEVTGDYHTQHRTVLGHNRAQLLVVEDRLEEALAQYDEILSEDPNHSEYHLDHATALRRAGRIDEALEALARAIQLGLPYPEPHYNRADLLAELGDVTGAVTDLGYVLELDPEFADARVNLAALLIELGYLEEASQVAAGATREDAPLLTVRGQIAIECGDNTVAEECFDSALRQDESYVPALAGRASLRFERGTPEDLRAAVADLEAAVVLSDDPDLSDNLAVARSAVASVTE